jgi:DNA polymerase III delta prime subunit
MSECVDYEPCPGCGSSDNLARYSDGHGYCFGCRTYFHADGRTEKREDSAAPADPRFEPVAGDYRAIPARGLDIDDCRHWGYQITNTSPNLHIMNWRDAHGRLIAQKFRDRDKNFTWIGDTNAALLYGQWLWPSKGKSVVVTEGELDAISVSKSFGHKWPVVSLPNGCGSLKKGLAKSYDWLDGFEKIVLWFDADEPGQKAVAQAVELLPPGKVWIARAPEGCKDANDTLREHGTDAIRRAFWDASLWKPDGIVEGREFTRERLKHVVDLGYPWPYPKIQEATEGLRKQEVTLLTAGPGMGKSTLARELAHYLVTEHHCKIGNIFLEEGNEQTARAYVAIDNNVPLRRLKRDPGIVSDDAWDGTLERVLWDKMWFYNHFGSVAGDSLVSRIEYYARCCGIDFAILDHISIVTSGLESSREGERKDIDILMTKLAQCTQRTGIGIIGIVHLKRVDGVEFNEGGQVSLSHLRGSGALEQLSHNVYALERDQQAPGWRRNVSQLRVLKCRETGDTGAVDKLIYDRDTGRLKLFTSAFRKEEDGFEFTTNV